MIPINILARSNLSFVIMRFFIFRAFVVSMGVEWEKEAAWRDEKVGGKWEWAEL